MKQMRLLPIAGLIASMTLAACGGGGGGSSMPAQPANNPSTGGSTSSIPQSLMSFDWGQSFMKHVTYVGPVSERASIGMQVMVKMRNATGLVKYAESVSDPKSSNYRHFLTPQAIADTFGATQSDYQTAAAYFTKNGLHVSGWPQREMINVTGPISGFETAFGTKFGFYKGLGSAFIAPSGSPHTTVPVPIAQVAGMLHINLRQTYVMGIPNGGAFHGYSPQQMQRAFDFTGPYAKGDNGKGITVAIVGTGPISGDDADAKALSTLFSIAHAPITQVDVTDQGVSAGLATGNPSPLPSPVTYPYSSGFQSPPPVTAPCTGSLPACNPEDVEAQLDTETVSTMVPGANVLFYLGYNPNDCWATSPNSQNNTACPAGQGKPEIGIAESDPEIQQIIADNKADVVSLSYGLGEPFGSSDYPLNSAGYYNSNGVGYGPVEFASMVAEGMAVFASSGDTGAFECGTYGFAFNAGNPPCVSYPAGDENVVSVGGVLGPLNADGTLRTQFTAWGWQTLAGGNGSYQNNIGSGGGVSAIFPAPPWQASQADIQALGHGMRTQPDISMMADPNSGPTIAANADFGAQFFAEGGTSLATPQMASMWALVLEACSKDPVCGSKGIGKAKYRLGNPAPLLYAIYANKAQYASTFTDVTYGNNSAIDPIGDVNNGYSAGSGYDLVTGIGVPSAGHLINAIVSAEGGASPVLP